MVLIHPQHCPIDNYTIGKEVTMQHFLWRWVKHIVQIIQFVIKQVGHLLNCLCLFFLFTSIAKTQKTIQNVSVFISWLLWFDGSFFRFCLSFLYSWYWISFCWSQYFFIAVELLVLVSFGNFKLVTADKLFYSKQISWLSIQVNNMNKTTKKSA